MTKAPIISKASVDVSVSTDALFSLLTAPGTAERITGKPAKNDFTVREQTGSGILSIGGGVFFVRFAPYEAELNANQAKIKLRVAPAPNGCRVMVAAASLPDSDIDLSAGRLQEILSNLRRLAEDAGQAPVPAAPMRETPEPPPEFSSLPGPEAEPPAPARTGRRGRGGRLAALLLALLVLGALAASIFYYFRGFVEETDMSYRVNRQNADGIRLGSTQNQISFLLGTNGLSQPDGQVVYRSVAEIEDKRPAEWISVAYDGAGRAESVSYLNLQAATSVYKIRTFDAELTPEMTADEIVERVGLPLSLYRRYRSAEGDLIEEIHFGYVDPFANFNPAWRGEFVVEINRTLAALSVKNWGWYDGSDPLMVGSLEDHPLSNQYDDYTDFLNDRFQYNRSLLLLNRYSLGDTKFFFDGEPAHYSDNLGYQFYTVDSEEKLPGTETPLYRISVGYDYRSAFRMASFSNMRLYNRAGMLKDSDYRSITRGMSYGEVREIMKILPTALYIDASYFSICYGRFLNTDVADEQFEVIIRFDIENNYAQQVLINTAVSAVTDQPAETEAAAPPDGGA